MKVEVLLMVVVVVIEVVSSNGDGSCSGGSGSLRRSQAVVVVMMVVVRWNPALQTPRTVYFLQSKSLIRTPVNRDIYGHFSVPRVTNFYIGNPVLRTVFNCAFSVNEYLTSDNLLETVNDL